MMKTPIHEAGACVGGLSALAKALNVTPAAISEWGSRRRPVPAIRCVQIEAITGGVVRRWHLRPDDWHKHWPELVAHPDAPPVPAEAGAA